MAEQEPDYCAEARIIDAASWLVKAAVQLRTLADPAARAAADHLERNAGDILVCRREWAEKGSRIDNEAHENMVRHALLSAAGHALYAGQRARAYDLLRSYEVATVAATGMEGGSF